MYSCTLYYLLVDFKIININLRKSFLILMKSSKIDLDNSALQVQKWYALCFGNYTDLMKTKKLSFSIIIIIIGPSFSYQILK